MLHERKSDINPFFGAPPALISVEAVPFSGIYYFDLSHHVQRSINLN